MLLQGAKFGALYRDFDQLRHRLQLFPLSARHEDMANRWRPNSASKRMPPLRLTRYGNCTKLQALTKLYAFTEPFPEAKLQPPTAP